jgi:broad specificity phosphatase PhoE
MQLYLITHALTHQDRATEATQWRLSAQGQAQAALLAQQPFWVQIDRILVSSEPKTRLTVESVLAVRPLPVWSDPLFDELRRPGWTVDYTAQVRQAFAVPDQAAGEWEPANGALQRFLTGIGFIRQEFAGETLALVGHGLTLSLYRAYLLGQTRVNLADWQQLSFAAVALVDPEARHMLQDFQPVAGHSPRG